MQLHVRHTWDLDVTQALRLQQELAAEVDTSTPMPPWEILAAADVSYNRGEPRLYAGVVVVRAGSFEVLERVGVSGPAAFPYVPGLLSFREAPALLDAFERLRTRPDVVMCDGQGIAHPRRLGIASHLGLWLEVPTIGCAKSRLCGVYEEPGPNRGDRSWLTHRGEIVGVALRTRSRVQPVFVSPGHLCDMEGAVATVLATLQTYRLPTPARMAHNYVNEVRRAVSMGQPIPE